MKHALFRSVPILCLCLLVVTVLFQSLHVVAAQTTTPIDDCADIRWLMQRDQTPYDLRLGGGFLQINQTVSSQLDTESWGDYWAFAITLPKDDFGNTVDTTVTFQFNNIAASLAIEAALFKGMENVPQANGKTSYQPVGINGASFSFTLSQDGQYTLAVQRQHVANPDNGTYDLTLKLDNPNAVVTTPAPSPIKDLTSDFSTDLTNALETLDLEAKFFLHIDAPKGVSSRQNQASQVFFDSNFSFYVGTWADRVYLVGGNLAVKGTTRTFYVENYDYRAEFKDDPELNNFTDGSGNSITGKWDQIAGVWMLENCTGIKYTDGHTFVAYTPPVARSIRYGEFPTDDCEAFLININALGVDGISANHRFCFTRHDLAPEPHQEMLLDHGVLSFSLDAAYNSPTDVTEPNIRDVHLQTTDANLIWDEANAFWNIALRDQQVNIVLDWTNMKSFDYTRQMLTLSFLDAPRTSTQRSGVNLDSFEAIDDVIRIVYKPGGTADHEERLLLPASDSYLEIISPAETLPYNPASLPNQAGYRPSSLNNLGGDCYPVNTLLPQANCEPNGHINTANGNLWYGVTDQQAFGKQIDLTLTRSYNSYDAALDGPFGMGWTSNLLLDYNVAFNSAQNSRPITTVVSQQYRVGLDLIRAPRGLVTFQTPSGSRHLFIGQWDANGKGTLTALNMPGWRLTRENWRSTWTLEQSESGLTYEFDRAGRLLKYGYPAQNRVITVTYPLNTLNGPKNSGTQLIFITDAPNLRRLELYFDQQDHIALSVLRDLTVGEIPNDQSLLDNWQNTANFSCDTNANCYPIRYTYENNQLISVSYSDGQLARYAYDEQNRLIWHDDPRAPVAQTMHYAYDENADSVQSAYVLPAGTPAAAPLSQDAILWRQLSVITTNTERRVTVTDEHNSQRTYTYKINGGVNFSDHDNVYTLIAETSPLPDQQAADFGAQDLIYRWQNGLLTSISLDDSHGTGQRNTIQFSYNPVNNQFQGIQLAYPRFDLTFNSDQLTRINFPDGTTRQYTAYNDQGLPTNIIDQHGAAYTYTYDENNGWLTSVENGETRTKYTYDDSPAGLIASVTRIGLAAPQDAGFTTTYTWDGLGRLISISQPDLGDTCLSYVPGHANCTEPAFEDVPTCLQTAQTPQSIRVVDPLGTVSIYRFDGRKHLVDSGTFLPNVESGFSRRTLYQYDEYGRVITQNECLAAPILIGKEPTEENKSGVPTTTRYTYQNVASIEAVPSLENQYPQTIINGYSLTTTDTQGRTQTIVYDALDRVRLVIDILGRRSRYDYESAGTLNLTVVQHDYRDTLTATTQYAFNPSWQLTKITRISDPNIPPLIWDVLPSAENVTYRAIQSQSTAVQAVTWGNYSSGLPSDIEINLTDPITNRASETDPQMRPTYDTFGRLTTLTETVNGEDRVTRLAYCALSEGHFQIRRSLPAEADAVFNCTSPASAIAVALTYDSLGRLIETRDSFGVRSFIYTPDAQNHLWLVKIVATNKVQTQNWEAKYNAAGELVEWQDENGRLWQYQYDTLGRMLRVYQSSAPEASYTYTYNAASLVTQVIDDADHGFSYDYNGLGQVSVEQNLSTADSRTFLYDAEGRLTGVVASSGGTTIYQYNDQIDPTRLTHIIGPNGAIETFNWNDARQRIEYTDPLKHLTSYVFDSLGQLRGITDANQQRYTLAYDASGNLLTITKPPGNTANPNLTLAYTAPNTIQIDANSPSDWGGWSFMLSPTNTLTSATNPAGNSMTFAYTPLGQLASIEAGEDHIWKIERTADGITFTDGFNNQQQITFDAQYRQTTQDGVNYEYVPASNGDINLKITYLDGSIRVYTFSPGSSNPPTPPQIILYVAGVRVTYSYNSEGLLTDIQRDICLVPGDYVSSVVEIKGLEALTAQSVVEPCEMHLDLKAADFQTLSTTERFVYNPSNQLIRAIDAEQNIKTFAYDDAGNLITYQNSNGDTYAYTYDALNRLASLTGPTGIRLFLGYNNLNRIVGICQTRIDDVNATNFDTCPANQWVVNYSGYDDLGRLTEQTTDLATNAQITYQYAAQGAGQLTGWGAGDLNTTLSYTADALALLEKIDTGDSTYTLDYRTLNSLVSAGNLNFLLPTLSNSGSPATLNINGREITYIPNATDYGYTLRDEQTGAALTYVLDGNGVLKTVSYSRDDLNAESQISTSLEGTNLLNMTILSIEEGTTANTTTLTVDRLGNAIATYHDAYNLGFDYETSPQGQIIREQLFGDSARFNDANGYIIVNAYDGRGLPITTRISAINDNNAQANGDLLYVATINYDVRGRLIAETRQYADGTSVQVTYDYDDSNHLTTRTINVTHPLANAPTPTAVSGILFLGFVASRKRRVASALLALVCAFSTLGLLVSAQDAALPIETYVYTYTYDAADNLKTITTADETCAAYDYDGANRLVRVTANNTDTAYAYDVYGRLTNAGEQTLVYDGANNTPVLSGAKTGTTFYAELPSGPSLFAADGAGISWLLHNGRQSIRGLENADINEQSVWLVDPLGRFITQQVPSSTVKTQCLDWFAPPDDTPDLLPLPGGVIWDKHAQLYFIQGRAYAAEIGRFLQPDPHSVDVSGSLYNYAPQTEQPPILRHETAYLRGLQTLYTAQQYAQMTTWLTAESIKNQHLPQPSGLADNPLVDLLHAPNAGLRDRLASLISLPSWLNTSFNLSTPKLNAQNGALNLNWVNAPGQSTFNTADLLDFNQPIWGEPIWIPEALPSLNDWLPELLNQAIPPSPRLTSYIPNFRQPELLQSGDIQPPYIPQLDTIVLPQNALERIPHPLNLSQSSFDTLQLVENILEIPSQTSAGLLQQMLDASLPTAPQLPASNGEAWLTTRFSDRIFDTPQMSWSLPPPPNFRLDTIGLDWLYPQP